MKRLWCIPFCAAALAAAEEPPAPPTEEGKPDHQVIDVITEEDLEEKTSPITLKQITPQETISLDEAVDMPSDI